MSAIDDIMSLFQIKGSAPNGGEKVSQLEHALQCAHLAQSANAPPSMVAAALLHDIGHLLDDAPNAPHEHLGYSWVAEHFPETVSEPVRLHVAAKRYLCATDGGYHDQLSPASVQSLHIQGGPMTDTELDAFATLGRSIQGGEGGDSRIGRIPGYHRQADENAGG
jgi:gamma-butyrobetaine dioxygenase